MKVSSTGSNPVARVLFGFPHYFGATGGTFISSAKRLINWVWYGLLRVVWGLTGLYKVLRDGSGHLGNRFWETVNTTFEGQGTRRRVP